MQDDLKEQIDHNLRVGLLQKGDGDNVRYSWRGLIYVYLQFMRDLVRL